jgi:hypothetical protein
VAIGVGILLTILSAVTYHESMTALIPAFFGVPILILGLLAFKESLRKHVMHAAAALGLIGLIGAVGALIARGGVEGTSSIVSQVVMGVLCGAFVGLCVRSFIVARRSRAESGERRASGP